MVATAPVLRPSPAVVYAKMLFVHEFVDPV
jgi:hypothetical protein